MAYAIGTIDSLPEARQENSDRYDMARLLAAIVPNEMERNLLAFGVEVHTGRRPELSTEARLNGGAAGLAPPQATQYDPMAYRLAPFPVGLWPLDAPSRPVRPPRFA